MTSAGRDTPVSYVRVAEAVGATLSRPQGARSPADAGRGTGQRRQTARTRPQGGALAVWPQPPPPKDSAPLQRHFVPFLRRGLLGPSPTVG